MRVGVIRSRIAGGTRPAGCSSPTGSARKRQALRCLASQPFDFSLSRTVRVPTDGYLHHGACFYRAPVELVHPLFSLLPAWQLDPLTADATRTFTATRACSSQAPPL